MHDGEIRRLARELFGNRYLLEVAAQISRFSDGQFIVEEIVRATGIPRNRVDLAMKKLLAAELLKKLPESGREHPYERMASGYWRLCERFLQELRKA
ncbi:MAG: hypothetical protein HYU28_10315 [Actinobacteria bacterium]|nr:hypothetical protein [Actinomycetota bacterium]